MPEQGSSFWFELLLTESVDSNDAALKQDDHASTSVTTSVQHELTRHDKTLMFVSTDYQLYEELLASKCNVTPIYASSIEVACKYLNQEIQPAVILVDLESSIDGLNSFLYQLKEASKQAHIPIISIADSISVLTENTTMQSYIDYTIFRPINVQHAWAVIKKMLK